MQCDETHFKIMYKTLIEASWNIHIEQLGWLRIPFSLNTAVTIGKYILGFKLS